MPYIGNPIYQSAFVVDQFSGNGSTVAFTMSVAPAGVTNVLVAVSGVLQDPSTYGVVGNTITFSAAPPTGTGNISCRYLGVPVTGVTTTAYRTVTEFTATASQTTFTPPSYTVGFINVYLNGVLLGSADYTATNGTTVVLATGASAGNLVTVESFLVSSVLNAIPNTAGSVSSANIQTSPTLTTPTIDKINTSVTNTSLGAGNSSTMKNRIINGAMVINQRGFSGSMTTGGDSLYTLDRWRGYFFLNDKYSVSQNAGSITPPVGFVNYLGVTSSAATTVGSTDYYMMRQTIEGYNIADLGWGTASAKTVTLSFWVRSSLTGTFGGSVENSAGTYSYPFSYTISSANTWEQKTVTIVGQTAGTWATNNTAGLIMQFSLGVGSTLRGTANTWANAEYWSVTGETQVVATSGATWYVTGVQLEVGTQATGFEYRQYTNELNLCQRYYFKADPSNQGAILGSIYNNTAVRAFVPISYHVTMRTTPTLSYTIGNGTANTDYSSVDYAQVYLTITTTGYLSTFAATAEL